MKNKYQRLSKVEKKEACDKFKNSEDNINKVYEKLTRLKVFGIIGFCLIFISTLFDIFITSSIITYIVDGISLLICFIAAYKADETRSRLVNSFLINESKKK